MSKKIKVKKAVFPVAGLGTRFLPATKSMPKELLPVINKPLIQYAAEEAIEAGIDTLIFVTGRNKRAIEDHFDTNFELEYALKKKADLAKLSQIKEIIPNNVSTLFVRQPQQLGLGHAILCAEKAVGNEPFAVLLADDFISGKNTNVISDLIKSYKRSNKNQLSIQEIDKENISKYGVIIPGKSDFDIKGIIEKPNLQDAPSNLASIGRYVLNPQIFDIKNTGDL